jgi:hypothetical protein
MFTLEEIPTLKRPPSYSDSFYVLHNNNGSINTTRTSDADSVTSEDIQNIIKSAIKTKNEKLPVAPRIYLFLVKVAIHIFLVSVFETVFFFKYVSLSENSGVLHTINTYYEPIKDSCPLWNNQTKLIIYDILQSLNYPELVLEGNQAQQNRISFNNNLLGNSLTGSGVCFAIMLFGSAFLKYKKTPVRWWVIFTENLAMVSLLGLYEYLFFHYIVYNYSTISTPELNSYIASGLYECVTN